MLGYFDTNQPTKTSEGALKFQNVGAIIYWLKKIMGAKSFPLKICGCPGTCGTHTNTTSEYRQVRFWKSSKIRFWNFSTQSKGFLQGLKKRFKQNDDIDFGGFWSRLRKVSFKKIVKVFSSSLPGFSNHLSRLVLTLNFKVPIHTYNSNIQLSKV